MTDDFFQQMQADWAEQPVEREISALHTRLQQRLAADRVARLAGYVLMAIAMVAGVFILWRGVQREDLVSILGAVTMLVSLPVSMFVTARARRALPVLEDRSPEGVLRYALKHAEASQRMIGLSRWGPFVLVALVLVLWACVLAGLAPASRFLMLVTVVWLAAGLASWAWLEWSGARMARERRQCEALLQQYHGAERPDA